MSGCNCKCECRLDRQEPAQYMLEPLAVHARFDSRPGRVFVNTEAVSMVSYQVSAVVDGMPTRLNDDLNWMVENIANSGVRFCNVWLSGRPTASWSEV